METETGGRNGIVVVENGKTQGIKDQSDEATNKAMINGKPGEGETERRCGFSRSRDDLDETQKANHEKEKKEEGWKTQGDDGEAIA